MAMFTANIFGNAMRNQPPPPPEPEKPSTPTIIEIVDFGDLVVQVYTPSVMGERYTNATGFSVPGKLLASFKVSRQALMRNSTKFEQLLDAEGLHPEGKQKTIDMKNNSSEAVEIWFRQFHGKITEETYKLKVEELRALIDCQREHAFKLEKLNDWFAKWMIVNGGEHFEVFNLDDLRALMYPCQEFNHAEGFMYATMRLAYDTPGHVHEDVPPNYAHLHLEPRIIASINAARGSLKTKIHEALYTINKRFLEASCHCRKEGLYAYETALHETGVWPLEKAMHGRNAISITAVLEGLARFDYISPNEFCRLCAKDFGSTTIARCIENTEVCFEGLCLDCIDTAGKRDWDFDYVQQNTFKFKKFKKVMRCRVDHDEPTWYFSWLARKDRVGEAKPEMQGTSRKRKADEMEDDDD